MAIAQKKYANYIKIALFNLLIVFTVPFCGLAQTTKSIPRTSDKNWKQLDIIPMPKQIKLTDSWLQLNGSQKITIILGKNKSKQAEIGADWINEKIASLNEKTLPIASNKTIQTKEISIIIGTRNGNKLIDNAVKKGLVNVAENNPGKRGYEIRLSANKNQIYLAGADSLGTLYACITFAELISKRDNGIFWRECEVRDWPDFLNIPLGGFSIGDDFSPEVAPFVRLLFGTRNDKDVKKIKEKYLAGIKKHYNRLLHWKVSSFEYNQKWKNLKKLPKSARHLMREGINYGKERGIGTLKYNIHPFVGEIKEHPDVVLDCAFPSKPKGWVCCWSKDKLRKEQAEKVADVMKDYGFTDIGFHDTDTGGYDNPAYWNKRCKECKKRWGDDYISAIVHKHKIYYDALRKVMPDVRIHFTVYPYHIEVLDSKTGEDYLEKQYGKGLSLKVATRKYKKKYEIFWKRLHNELPSDITFCIRETTPEAVQALRRLAPGRGIFSYIINLKKTWESFFSEGPSWASTFFNNKNDFYYPKYINEYFVPLHALALREYTWNVKAPGASPWSLLPEAERWKHGEPKGKIYSLVLPHIIRNLFGRAVEKNILTAVKQNIEPRQIFNEVMRTQYVVLKNYKSMKRQAEKAEIGVKALDSIWEQHKKTGTKVGMNNYAFKRFVWLREVFHGCMWMSRLRGQNFLALELAHKKKAKKAEIAINKGLALIDLAKKDLAKLIEERPAKLGKRKGSKKRYFGWRKFVADKVDLDSVKNILLQTRKKIPALVSLSEVPKKILKKLASNRHVVVVKRVGKITIDGKMKEDVWEKAFPAEAFLVYKKDKKVAEAYTRGYTLYDSKNLYFGFTCAVPKGKIIPKDDTVEVFLKAPGKQGDYIHVIINANGNIRQQRGKFTDEARTWKLDKKWKSQNIKVGIDQKENQWNVELKIPLSDIGISKAGKGIAVNYARACPLSNGLECSSLLPPNARNFHDVGKFIPVVFMKSDYHTSQFSLDVLDFKLETKTLSHAIASIASFGLDIKSNQILNNVKIYAEAYNAQGDLQVKKELAAKDRLYYFWHPSQKCEMVFQETVKSGGIKLTLSCDEGKYTRWYRFGAWAGTAKEGSIFAKDSKKNNKTSTTNTALAAPCAFPGKIRLKNNKTINIFNNSAGTIEFKVKPDWKGFFGVPKRTGLRFRKHCFIHYGPVRKKYPFSTNNSPLTIYHDSQPGKIYFSTRNYKERYGLTAISSIRSNPSWKGKKWIHLAFVWDTKASPADKIRIYVDGKRVPTKIANHNKKGKNKTPVFCMKTDQPFFIQVGSLNSGRNAADSQIDELRISRCARYNKNFAPLKTKFKTDKNTSALFHFNNNLIGQGVSPEGKKYTIDAIAK